IAIIITLHMPMNVAAAPAQDCPGMRIHAIDIVQPPGMSIPGIADMDAHHDIVSAALPRNSSAAVTKKRRVSATTRTTASALAVLVIALPPDSLLLVAAERRAIQPLVHAPQAVESARVGGVAVVNDA